MNLAEEIKARLTGIDSVLTALGLYDGSIRQSQGRTVCCPWHSEKKPSCSVTIGASGTIRAFCFGCGKQGDILDLIAMAHNLDAGDKEGFKRVLAIGADLAGITEADRHAPRAPTRPLQPPKPKPPEYPPDSEVKALWESARPVTTDTSIIRALLERGIDPDKVEGADLARVLPVAPLPPWAGVGAPKVRTWADTGHRLLFPLYDYHGAMQSLRARFVGAGEPVAKSLAPKGYQVKGLILACPVALQLLRAGAQAEGEPVYIAEGEPDYLTVRQTRKDGAVIGITGAGAITPELGKRIPRGHTVFILTHHDQAGDKYAGAIVAALPNHRIVRTKNGHE